MFFSIRGNDIKSNHAVEPPSFIQVLYDYNDTEGGLLNRKSEEQSLYQAKWLCDVMRRQSNKKNPHHAEPNI